MQRTATKILEGEKYPFYEKKQEVDFHSLAIKRH